MSLQNDETVGGTPEVEDLVVHDNGIEVISAPPFARMAMTLLADHRQRGVTVFVSGRIAIGTKNTVFYRPIGVEDGGRVLVLRRED